jgi:hypothetical protein
MELAEVQWQTLIRHTAAANYPSQGSRNAPDAVMLTLAALVGDVDQIGASHIEFTWDAPTVWST